MIFFLSVRGYGKLLNVREKSGKSQGILKWMIGGNPVPVIHLRENLCIKNVIFVLSSLLLAESKKTGIAFPVSLVGAVNSVQPSLLFSYT